MQRLKSLLLPEVTHVPWHCLLMEDDTSSQRGCPGQGLLLFSRLGFITPNKRGQGRAGNHRNYVVTFSSLVLGWPSS